MPVPIAKGVIVITALLVTAGIALYESPQVRRFFEQNRQKVLETLYPDSYPLQPTGGQRSERSTGRTDSDRPDGKRASGVDLEEKRRKRQALMKRNAEVLAAETKRDQQKPAATSSHLRKDSGHASFDDFLDHDLDQPGRYRMRQEDQTSQLRHRNAGIRDVDDTDPSPSMTETLTGTGNRVRPVAGAVSAVALTIRNPGVLDNQDAPAERQEVEDEAQKALQEWEAQTQDSEAFSEVEYTPSTLSLVDFPDTADVGGDESNPLLAGAAPVPVSTGPPHQSTHAQSIREWALHASPSNASGFALNSPTADHTSAITRPQNKSRRQSETRTETNSVVDLADDMSSIEGEKSRDQKDGEPTSRKKHLDVMSEASEGRGFVTPNSWTEVGSQVSEEDTSATPSQR